MRYFTTGFCLFRVRWPHHWFRPAKAQAWNPAERKWQDYFTILRYTVPELIIESFAPDTVREITRAEAKRMKKGRSAPAPVPAKADDSLFRRDLKTMEENNLKHFGGKKGN